MLISLVEALMTLARIGLIVRWCCAAVGLFALAHAFAQTYPNRPIRLVIPYPAGGTTDGVARLVMPKVSQALGQQVVIDNRPGASGTIGEGIVAKAAPDGYTLLMVFDSHAVNPSLYKKLPYDSFADLTPISLLVTAPVYLVVPLASPANSVKELIALAKAKPGKLNYGSSGPGTSNHMAAELFKVAAGVDIVHIPYKGGAPATLAILAGEIDMIFGSAWYAVPLINGGKVKALAVAAAKRTAVLPAVPTLSEQGIAHIEMNAWVGLLAPARTPKPIVARWNAEVAKALKSPDVVKMLSDQGVSEVASSPEAFGKFIHSEAERWGKLVRDQNITLD
jgi:tripartite-type tricarboxylate transporter receptor subunit TctC